MGLAAAVFLRRRGARDHPVPASLGHDQFAAAGIMYNGSLFIGANMPIDRDVDGTVARMADLLVGPGREEAS